MFEKRENKSKLIPTSAKQCIWVDAGVISYRLCPLNYECERCSLHQALVDGPAFVPPHVSPSPKSEENVPQRAEFEEFFKKLPASARKCHYMFTGDISYKLCINGFNCSNCSFQQMMEDSDRVETDWDIPIDDSQLIDGFRFPQGVHYHRGHTWIRIENQGNVRVGVDNCRAPAKSFPRVHEPAISALMTGKSAFWHRYPDRLLQQTKGCLSSRSR
jgi:hypothetical protein